MKYLHYNHVVAADAFSDSPDYLHGIIKFGNESSVGAAPSGRPLSLSNKPDNCLTNTVVRDCINRLYSAPHGDIKIGDWFLEYTWL